MDGDQKTGKTEQAIGKLLNHCVKRTYPANRPVIRPGQIADQLFYIVEGSVDIRIGNPSWRYDLILEILQAGQFIGEAGLFGAATQADIAVRTRTDAVIAEIRIAKIRQLLDSALKSDAAVLLSAIGEQLAGRLSLSNRNYINAVQMDIPGRIAVLLLDLARGHSISHPKGSQIKITRQEIGQMVGCSRERAGQVLKMLAQQNFIHAYGKTVVIYGD